MGAQKSILTRILGLKNPKRHFRLSQSRLRGWQIQTNSKRMMRMIVNQLKRGRKRRDSLGATLDVFKQKSSVQDVKMFGIPMILVWRLLPKVWMYDSPALLSSMSKAV